MSSLQILFSLNTTFNSIAKFIKKPSVPLQNDLDMFVAKLNARGGGKKYI